MHAPNSYVVAPGVARLFSSQGVAMGAILRRAGLPEDRLDRLPTSLSAEDYFSLWQAMEDETGDAKLAVTICSLLSLDDFDGPLFAALCSPNLQVALWRLARYKRLIAPIELRSESLDDRLILEIRWHDQTLTPPQLLVTVELLFFVCLARLATRARVEPLALTAPSPPRDPAFRRFLGCSITPAASISVVFRRSDALRPFVTADAGMWRSFEPQLRARLQKLDDSSSCRERVHGALLELLPAGSSSLDEVSLRLGLSRRTLQRRLSNEGISFQAVLARVREQLAHHYLERTDMSGGEIALLLGYEEATSFFRAFHAWTGRTPGEVRQSKGVG